MSAYDADADELIAQGWGSHKRGDIPDDWRTRRGPDVVWHRTHKSRCPPQDIRRGRKPKYSAK